MILNLHTAGVFFKDGRTGEAEELGVGEKLFDGAVVIAELGTVALVEDEDDALVAKRCELFAEIASVGAIQRKTEFLDGADDDFVGVVVREETAHEGGGIGVSSTQPSWNLLNSSRVCRSRSLRSTTKRHFSMSGLSLRRVEALNEVSVLPLPVVCQM